MQELTTAGIGRRMLGEIEEVGLDEVLASFRANHHNSHAGIRNPISSLGRIYPITGLNELMQTHSVDTTRNNGGKKTQQQPPLAICGRYYPELLYRLIATLISPPWEKTISIIDFDGKFEALRLLVAAKQVRKEDLGHVYLWMPGQEEEEDCFGEVERYMLYGDHESREREWWGTVVIGGSGNGRRYPGHVGLTAGRSGWMRVGRVEVPGFGGKGVEHGLREREKRQEVVEKAGWVGSCAWGEFVFGNK
ncbi:hypothetical protein QBC38DRAFT_375689 [Podospora fimiseda]|uniref:Uncharacterized protein n=1 Tax=Podospora fimiseda TaxID=252190 RepID=A0AAN6YPL8_9PEZI|nr:hypothetical protein QBC38DRAFT_375689 [Podospora fimiseda]